MESSPSVQTATIAAGAGQKSSLIEAFCSNLLRASGFGEWGSPSASDSLKMQSELQDDPDSMAIKTPDYIFQHYQNPAGEIALQRHFYVHGDPDDPSTHHLLKMLTPLQIGDFVHLDLGDGAPPERRRVERIEHHEMDLHGLGDSEYLAFVLFSPAGAH